MLNQCKQNQSTNTVYMTTDCEPCNLDNSTAASQISFDHYTCILKTLRTTKTETKFDQTRDYALLKL